jgi:hypothetical protein
MTEEAGFDSRQRASDFSFLHNVLTDSGAHPASYTMGTKVCLPGVKHGGVKLTTQLHQVLKLRMAELHRHSPIAWSLLNQAQGYLYLTLPYLSLFTLFLSPYFVFFISFLCHSSVFHFVFFPSFPSIYHYFFPSLYFPCPFLPSCCVT